MRRYKCIVEYDGTSFVGWQRQTNGYSVQEAVEKWTEIKKLNSKIKLHMIGKLQTNKVKFALKIFDDMVDRGIVVKGFIE